ncbi:MAG: hypothetical protein QNJ74_14955 [Trichodesmium sp. MO_231.B1]|nr:hypothetical protein [Trichodesmium sp. MO_231.B1]
MYRQTTVCPYESLVMGIHDSGSTRFDLNCGWKDILSDRSDIMVSLEV